MNSPSRSTLFDVLRAIAVLLVLGRHILDTKTGMPDWVVPVLTAWREIGWMGVDLFFVLSGFLVSGLLFAEYRQHETLRPWHFLGRRGFKIYPGFYLLLAVTWFWRGDTLPAEKFFYEAVFIQNYFGRTWNHTWSLAIEEHFYFGLTLLFWLAVRLRRPPDPFRWLPAFTLVVGLAVLGMRTATFLSNPKGYLLLPTHLRIDALLFGVLLSYAWTWHRERLQAFVAKYGSSIFLVSCALLLPSLLRPLKDDVVVNTIGLTTNYLGFGGFTLLAAAAAPAPRKWLTPLARIGYCSYSIYLWHMPVWAVADGLIGRRTSHPLGMAAYVAGSLVVGIVLSYFFEQPLLTLRDRLLPSRSRPAPT